MFHRRYFVKDFRTSYSFFKCILKYEQGVKEAPKTLSFLYVNEVPSSEETFDPPSMVCISIIIVHSYIFWHHLPKTYSYSISIHKALIIKLIEKSLNI